jgi:alkanesulfonate monooxygenase SsuD/methylene tetrahydromethanopterin reductase-like flavin-dependent oxidoreductase (luciferase family)
MSNPTLGWVVTPSTKSPEAAASLHADNRRFLDTLRGAFDTVWLEDHFQWTNRPMVEGWTTLCYLAGLYPDYRFGTLVFGQSYRNPALTAKMFATLQWLTGGRLIAGIGAGWKQDEYDAYGWPFPPVRTRLEQLEEAIRIIRLLWTQSPATFEGKHYSIREAYCEPRPEPPPPLLVAGGGEKVTLRLAARYADWMNIPFEAPDTTRRKLAALDAHCRDLGRPPDAVHRSYYAFVALSQDGRLPDARPGLHVIAGSPEAVTDQFRTFLEMGIEHFMIRFTDFPDLHGARLFLDEVYPRLA